jgi:chitinase
MRFLTVSVLLAAAVAIGVVNGACIRRVCYFANWAQYGPTASTQFFPNDIDPFVCTHIVYAFAKLTGNKLAPYEWNDLSSDGVVGGYEKATNLKNTNPNLKILVAVGGWSLGVDPFHHVVNTAASRNEFVTSTIQYLRAHKLDGLDIDWEYPANRGSPADDKHKFSLLVEELRQAFNAEASGSNRLLLSAAVAAGKGEIDSAYEVATVAQNLDWINLMTYDIHGDWDTVTGHNSPLYPAAGETGESAQLSVQWAANYWAQKGAPKNKIVIGMPLYGRSFTLTSSATGLGAPAKAGNSGPYVRSAGYLAYYEICEMISKGASLHNLNDQHVPYLVSGNQWVGYDNENSLREKVQFVKDNGFGGTMVWALDLDDVKGHFCGKGHFPLANAIKDECSK